MLADEAENKLELELLQTIKEAKPSQVHFYTNMAMDEKGERYYSCKQPEQKIAALRKAADSVANQRQRR